MFEFFILDTFQAGLSWRTILYKRENFRKAFDNFNINKIAKYGKRDFNRLMKNAGIIRNKAKINAAIHNSQLILGLKKEFGSFSKYLWKFSKNKVVKNKRRRMKDIVTTSPLSDAISKDMKERGFKFVGSTTIYAFIQSMGIVNDHVVDCFRYNKLG